MEKTGEIELHSFTDFDSRGDTPTALVRSTKRIFQLVKSHVTYFLV